MQFRLRFSVSSQTRLYSYTYEYDQCVSHNRYDNANGKNSMIYVISWVGCDYRLCLILAFDGCKIRFELLKTVQFNWALFCCRDENVAEFSNIFKGFKFLTLN